MPEVSIFFYQGSQSVDDSMRGRISGGTKRMGICKRSIGKPESDIAWMEFRAVTNDESCLLKSAPLPLL